MKQPTDPVQKAREEMMDAFEKEALQFIQDEYEARKAFFSQSQPRNSAEANRSKK